MMKTGQDLCDFVSICLSLFLICSTLFNLCSMHKFCACFLKLEKFQKEKYSHFFFQFRPRDTQTIFCTINIFSAKYFLYSKIFATQYFGPKIFLAPKFFHSQHFFGLKTFTLNFFGTNNFLWTKDCWQNQTSLWTIFAKLSLNSTQLNLNSN